MVVLTSISSRGTFGISSPLSALRSTGKRTYVAVVNHYHGENSNRIHNKPTTSNKCHFSSTPPTIDRPKVFSSLSQKWNNKKGSKTFQLSDQTDLLPTKPFEKVLEVFPGANTNSDFVHEICGVLENEGYDIDTTLLATSFCVDELNRTLEIELATKFNLFFNMGGLAGFPFGGVTGFGAMAAHIPVGGSCVIVHGSHVGIDSMGRLGTVERRGRSNGGDCCGSGVAASKYVSSVYKGEMEEASMPKDAIDSQQYFVGKMLLPYAEKLEKSEDKMLELPKALYAAQTDLMKKVIDKAASGVQGEGTIVLVGGIQINTPPEYTDYFVPMDFNIYDNKGNLLKTLWQVDNP